jgi:acetyltransferase-like isoleucine patch superfamily enzyme
MKMLLVLDRLAYFLFFRWYYGHVFAHYGKNVRWGRDFRRRVIPQSVRISCPEKIWIGDHCRFDEGVYLQCHGEGDGIVIGEGTRINAHTHVLAYSKISIGARVLVAPFALIASGDHGHASSDVPIMQQPYERSGEITIAEGAWIAHGAKVLGGSRIGRNVVVAAGAVVKGAFDDNSLVAGVPARCVRVTAVN